MNIFFKLLLLVVAYVFSLGVLVNVAFIPGLSTWMFCLFAALPVAAFVWFMKEFLGKKLDGKGATDVLIKLAGIVVILYVGFYAVGIFVVGAGLGNNETAWCQYPLEKIEFDEVVLYVSAEVYYGKSYGCVLVKDNWLPVMSRVGNFRYSIEEVEMLDEGVVRLRFENGKVEEFKI